MQILLYSIGITIASFLVGALVGKGVTRLFKWILL